MIGHQHNQGAGWAAVAERIPFSPNHISTPGGQLTYARNGSDPVAVRQAIRFSTTANTETAIIETDLPGNFVSCGKGLQSQGVLLLDLCIYKQGGSETARTLTFTATIGGNAIPAFTVTPVTATNAAGRQFHRLDLGEALRAAGFVANANDQVSIVVANVGGATGQNVVVIPLNLIANVNPALTNNRGITQ